MPAMIILLLFAYLPLAFANPDPIALDVSAINPLAYISNMDGRDVIVIRDGSRDQAVFLCDNENEMILTPSVNLDKHSISFVIENGTGLRDVHVLQLEREAGNTWEAQDSVIVSVNSGAWPTVDLKGNLFLSMKDPRNTEFTTATDIYSLSGTSFVKLSQNSGQDRHLWPLLSPNGDRLHFRIISKSDQGNHPIQKKSIIYYFASRSIDFHLVDQGVFIEQWTATNKLMYSFREHVETPMRIYYLYDVDSRQAIEIYRESSWQAKLSGDGKYLATLRNYPEGSAQYDIFIADIFSGQEINLTQSPQKSESLIGWLE